MILLERGKALVQRYPYHVAAAVFWAVLGMVFFGPYLSELPTGIHTWAQSDRLALAINFYDYGFHFFTPRTSDLSSIGGITGVEFPAQAYLAALGGLVFGRASIVTLFRLLDAAAVLLGAYYLFRLVYERTGNFVAGLVPGAFLLSSPVFAFYAVSTLPDPFSLSFTFVGYYYWLRFFDNRRFADLAAALGVLTLAALVKTTSALHWGAVVGLTFGWVFLQPALLSLKARRGFLVLVGLGAAAVVFFIFYNQYLNQTYRSWIFLARTAPIEDNQGRHDVLSAVRVRWLAEYATITQYRTIAACLGLLLVFIGRSVRLYLPLLLMLFAATAISYVFWLLMGVQFGGHDYYIICSMLPPVLLLLVLALLHLGRYEGRWRYGISTGLAVLVFFLLSDGYKRLHRRMSDEYPPFTPYSHTWMRGGAAEMKRAGVPPAARILVFDESTPNIAQVYFDRRGIAWQPYAVADVTVNELRAHMAADNLDYLVINPATYAQMASLHPALRAEFELVGQQPAWVFRPRQPLRVW